VEKKEGKEEQGTRGRKEQGKNKERGTKQQRRVENICHFWGVTVAGLGVNKKSGHAAPFVLHFFVLCPSVPLPSPLLSSPLSLPSLSFNPIASTSSASLARSTALETETFLAQTETPLHAWLPF